MRKELVVLVIIAIALIGMASAAKYMYVKASVTQEGFAGTKPVEKESGSANVISERHVGSVGDHLALTNCLANAGARNTIPNDYINFAKEDGFEYSPVGTASVAKYMYVKALVIQEGLQEHPTLGDGASGPCG